MPLKRYTTEELIDLGTNLFYDFLSDESNAEKIHKEYEEKENLYRDRITIYLDALNDKSLEQSTIDSLHVQLDFLNKGLQHLKSSNMKYQKDLYKKTGSTDFCRSKVRIPLDKIINSFYDDLCLEVVFYDDVCTLNSKFNDYKKLNSAEERRNFIKTNTEITHISLIYLKENQIKAVIAVKGGLNTEDPRVMDCGITLLPKKFSNFNDLTLADTSEIEKNDLKQFIQTKIDLDKENMEELASVLIRGDLYKIFKAPKQKNDRDELYIRYTCRSTGRVYFNKLNLRNLKISKYFKENDFESYCKSWWNLTHLGSTVEGDCIPAC